MNPYKNNDWSLLGILILFVILLAIGNWYNRYCRKKDLEQEKENLETRKELLKTSKNENQAIKKKLKNKLTIGESIVLLGLAVVAYKAISFIRLLGIQNEITDIVSIFSSFATIGLIKISGVINPIRKKMVKIIFKKQLTEVNRTIRVLKSDISVTKRKIQKIDEELLRFQ